MDVCKNVDASSSIIKSILQLPLCVAFERFDEHYRIADRNDALFKKDFVNALKNLIENLEWNFQIDNVLSSQTEFVVGEKSCGNGRGVCTLDIAHQDHIKFNPRCCECINGKKIRMMSDEDVLKFVGVVRQFIANCDDSDLEWANQQGHCTDKATDKRIRKIIEERINKVMTGRYLL